MSNILLTAAFKPWWVTQSALPPDWNRVTKFANTWWWPFLISPDSQAHLNCKKQESMRASFIEELFVPTRVFEFHSIVSWTSEENKFGLPMNSFSMLI